MRTYRRNITELLMIVLPTINKDFPQHERVTDKSQLKNVVKTDSVVKKKETVIKLDTEEKPSRPIPTLKMKVYDN
jgi:hypothetical protein